METGINSATLLLSVLCLLGEYHPAKVLLNSQPRAAKAESAPAQRSTVEIITIKLIDRRHGATKTGVSFQGTRLLPDARGEAELETRQGVTKIKGEFPSLPPAIQFGRPYLTYVLWAVTPQARLSNIGEIEAHGAVYKVEARVELEAFGLMVTAEPHLGVTQPSGLVVMEHEVPEDAGGEVREVKVTFEPPSEAYSPDGAPAKTDPWSGDPEKPLSVYEAYNAVRIARAAGADRYAPDTLRVAEGLLRQAEDAQARKADRKTVDETAHEAAFIAEDARVLALSRRERERQANNR